MERKTVKEQIEEMKIGFGGLCEMASMLRDAMISAGFTREEAVKFCYEYMMEALFKIRRELEEENDV